MTRKNQLHACACVVAAFPLVVCVTQAHAADGFQIRYNLAGSLGNEMFNVQDEPGWRAGLSLNHSHIDQVTGDDGQRLRLTAPGGTVKLAAGGTPFDPSYPAQSVEVDSRGSQSVTYAGVSYATESASYWGGRMSFGLSIPYGTKQQTVRPLNAIPALSWPNAGFPDNATKAAVTAGYAAQYQAGLDAQGAAETGSTSGLGDVDVSMGWIKAQEHSRLIVSASLDMPTGRYSTLSGPHIGYGKFYTLRPALTYVIRPTPDWALGVKTTLGLNTTNSDNHVRSGNWAGIEGAVGYKTSLGALGVHLLQAQQLQSDGGGVWGTNRFRSTNAGLSFATKIPVLDMSLALHYSKTLESRNAKSGNYSQLRLIKSF